MKEQEYKELEESFKPYANIIDAISDDACMEYMMRYGTFCNRDEMYRDAILQRLALLRVISGEWAYDENDRKYTHLTR